MRSISYVSAVAACLMLGGLGLLTLVDIFDGPGTARQERIATTPALPTRPAHLPRFLADARFHAAERYALKEQFVQLNGRVKLAFGHSSAPNVALGQGGFLFLNTPEAVAITQGQHPMDRDERARWQAHFEATRRAFAEQNLPYAFVLGPNKHSIYPDRTPAWLAARPLDRTRTAGLVQAARDAFGEAFVDTRTLLAQARRDQPDVDLYHPTDTHWTEWGAALALHEIVTRQGLEVPPPRFEVADLIRSGDLSRMIGQQGRWSATAPVLPDGWSCVDADGKPLTVVTIDPLMPRRFTCGTPGTRPEKLVVFVDSFGVSAVPYLASRFRTVEFIWSDAADPVQAAALGAEYVLHILVERKMTTQTPEMFLAGAQPSQ